MRKIIWSLVLVPVFFFNVGFGFALAAEPGASPPNIEFSEDLWDFGTIQHGDKVTHVFEVKNLGGTELIINRVRPSCGCTAALLSSSKVPPQGSAEIEVTFNSSGFKGKVSKYIYVESNDPDEPLKKLTITTVVEVSPSPTINLKENSWDFGLIVQGETVTFSLSIENTGERELQITKLRASPGCTAKLISPGSIPPGETGKVNLAYDSSEQTGLVREYLYIDSNDPLRKSVYFPISGYVIEPKPEFTIFPAFLDFGVIEQGKDYTVTIQLKNGTKRSIRIVNIDSPSEFITVSPSSAEVNPGEKLQIEIAFHPVKKPSPVQGHLYITIALPIEVSLKEKGK